MDGRYQNEQSIVFTKFNMVIWNLENTTSGVAQYVLPKPPSTAELGAADAIVDGTYSLATSVREAGLAIGFGKAFLVSFFV